MHLTLAVVKLLEPNNSSNIQLGFHGRHTNESENPSISLPSEQTSTPNISVQWMTYSRVNLSFLFFIKAHLDGIFRDISLYLSTTCYSGSHIAKVWNKLNALICMFGYFRQNPSTLRQPNKPAQEIYIIPKNNMQPDQSFIHFIHEAYNT